MTSCLFRQSREESSIVGSSDQARTSFAGTAHALTDGARPCILVRRAADSFRRPKITLLCAIQRSAVACSPDSCERRDGEDALS